MKGRIIAGYVFLIVTVLICLCAIIFSLANPLICLAIITCATATGLTLDMVVKLIDGKDNK